MLCLLLVGAPACPRAGRVVQDRFVAPGRFEVQAPASTVWTLASNHRGPRETVVVFRRRGGGAMMRVQVKPLPQDQDELPLDVLAQQVVLQEALFDGGLLELSSMSRILLDEREAVAFTGVRIERPVRWHLSSIVLRSQGFLLTLTYSARPELFEPLSVDFERLLRHFRISLPGPFDPYVLEDLPMGAPGPSPGNAHRRRAPKPQLVKPATGAPDF